MHAGKISHDSAVIRKNILLRKSSFRTQDLISGRRNEIPDGGITFPDDEIEYPDNGVQFPDNGVRFPNAGIEFPGAGSEFPECEIKFRDAGISES